MSRIFDREIIDGFFGNNSDEPKQRLLKKRLLKEFMEFNLTKIQKQYIMLYYKNNMTITQIADIFGVVPSTVSRTIKRARTRLYRAITGKELFSLYSKNGDKHDNKNSY